MTVGYRLEITQVKIDTSVIDPDDPELLEDLILTTINNTLKKSKDTAAQEMEKKSLAA